MRKRSDRGFALLLFGALAIPIVALLGLAIDTGVLYVVKGKLSAAVDAGALAGARALARGNDDGTQRSKAQSIGSSYAKLNFPEGYLNTRNLTIDQPIVGTNAANQRSVTVSGTVDVPTFFMRVFRQNSTTVSATATAIRRDVNIMLALDRSRSMDLSGSCDDMRAAASGFVTKFANGRDFLGLVTFATSTSYEFPIADNFATANPSLDDNIRNISCASGGTSSADALSSAYWQLAGLNAPAALNVIVFFTDGQPTAVHGSFPVAPGSPCGPAARPNLDGVWTVGGTSVWSLLSPSVGMSPIADDNRPAPNSNGCAFAQNWPQNVNNTNDYTHVPDTDVWGNSLDTGYQPGIGRANGRIRKDLAANVALAATNAAEDAARRIRTGAVMNGRTLPNVVIYGIGLGDASQPASHDFMLRVTNDPSSPTYTTAQREGLYVYAPTAADLNDAFTRLASEILRISQ